jgi:hypothetical protein
MGSLAGGAAGRVRWLALFTILLLAISAVPVLAESPPSDQYPGDVSMPSATEAEKLPDASDIAEGLQELREEDAAEKRWLESPEAEREREESRHAYTTSSASDTAELLDAFFAEHLALLDRDPLRALSDAKLEQVLSPTGAQVTVGGDAMLVEGTLPVRAPDEEGDMRKVDLDLAPVKDGFASANPLVEVELPDSASEPMTVGEEGLAIEAVLTEPAGEARLLDGEDVQYHETQEATDLIAAPLGTGLELFSLLRSVESPEELRFALTLPVAAELRPDGRGGAEVIRDTEQLARIPAPTALDAQGSVVPVTMRIEGTQLVLKIEHRGMDLSYPLLLDPTIQENWYDNNNDWYHYGNLWALNHWYPGTNDPGRFQMKTVPINASPGLSNRGLFVSASSYGTSQPSNRFGQYTYTAPGADTYFAAALINPFWRWDHGCGSNPQPHDYSGLWNATWGWAKLRTNWAKQWGYSILTFDDSPPEDAWKKKIGNVLVIGLGTENGGPAITCTRDLYAGGVNLWMDDWYQPTLSTSSSAKWMDKTPIRLDVSASDSGLGVKSFSATAKNTSGVDKTWWTNHACTGLRANPCPSSWNLSNANQPALGYDPSVMPEGINTLSVTAYDATQKLSTTTNGMTVRVDHAPPTIQLSGTLTEQSSYGTSRPRYTLRVDIYDGDSTNQRSGATGFILKVDGQQVDSYQPGCATQSCTVWAEYEPEASEFSYGHHVLQVIATDALGHPGTKELGFDIVKDVTAPSLSVMGQLFSLRTCFTMT